jgi:hypothetical protein
VVRRMLVVLGLAVLLWLLLAYHFVVIPGDPAFVVLKKTSWTFDSWFIGEGNWTAFSLHHPILMTRIAAGSGLWIFGRAP